MSVVAARVLIRSATEVAVVVVVAVVLVVLVVVLVVLVVVLDPDLVPRRRRGTRTWRRVGRSWRAWGGTGERF